MSAPDASTFLRCSVNLRAAYLLSLASFVISLHHTDVIIAIAFNSTLPAN